MLQSSDKPPSGLPDFPPVASEATDKERRVRRDRRRRVSVASFVRGGVRPRRRMVRRDDEGHLGLLDWHESRLMYLALGIVLLNCLDALFTLNLLTVGAREANLFMDDVLGQGVAHFLAVKFSLTSAGVVLLVVAAHRSFFGWFKVIRLLQLVFAGYVLLILYELYLFDAILGLSRPDALGWTTIFS